MDPAESVHISIIGSTWDFLRALYEGGSGKHNKWTCPVVPGYYSGYNKCPFIPRVNDDPVLLSRESLADLD